ncbi:hypothetical protein CTAYLR_002560 [Chrysophaeum taylorii]|uniref:Uncharacterized protein n=1 Tax=Chrysophaeum taylorii TaxID=2483200 RepID=A0AAD7UHJ9_9STRA|nr:hypothetical protein CTAYLR_002560 [Chrysophaeum taylorii]
MTGAEASASCCASDVTFAEFKSLRGEMDASVSTAMTPEEFLGGTADWRTDLYATCGTVVSLAESSSTRFTARLRGAHLRRREKLVITEYIDAGIDPADVWLQSFNSPDIAFWIANYPATFGAQAVFLDEAYWYGATDDFSQIKFHRLEGMLVEVENNTRAPSDLAVAAKAADLKIIITWTIRRSGQLDRGLDDSTRLQLISPTTMATCSSS